MTLLLVFLFLFPGLLAYIIAVHSPNFSISFQNITKPLVIALIYALITNYLFFFYLDSFICTIELFGWHPFESLSLLNVAVSHIVNGKISLIGRDLSKSVMQFFMLQIITASALALFVKNFIKWTKFDRKYDYFKFIGNKWQYYFTNSDIDVAYKNPEKKFTGVSVIVDYNDGTYLYNGLLKRHTLNSKNELDLIELKYAMRRRIDKDKTDGVEDDISKRFYDIDGESLFIRYENVKTLNLRFIELNLSL